MISLSNHVDKLSKESSIEQFQELLGKNYEVSVNWFGFYVVRIDGYGGSEFVDKIAAVFLSSITKPHEQLSLGEKLAYYQLWGKLDAMYNSKSLCIWTKSEVQRAVQGDELGRFIGRKSLLFFTKPLHKEASRCLSDSYKSSLTVGWNPLGKGFTYYSYTQGSWNSVEYYVATEQDIRKLLEKQKAE
jgi:hypothetical protein